jgi:hypothetical protein
MHGQNNSGKHNNNNSQKTTATPTIMKSKEASMDLSQEENTTGQKSDDELELNGTKDRTSGRCRKHPMKRKDDFLQSTGLPKRVG